MFGTTLKNKFWSWKDTVKVFTAKTNDTFQAAAEYLIDDQFVRSIKKSYLLTKGQLCFVAEDILY
jgi:hypothetical protein